MLAILEVVFDLAYLITVLTLGIIMLIKGHKYKIYVFFGSMALVLGLGDACHLIPRIYALLTTGFAQNAYILGIGKLITSITMTIFYILLYYIWRLRYDIKGQDYYTIIFFGLAIVRILLCLFPQNAWTSATHSYMWAIYRNIPFLLMGILTIIIFFKDAVLKHDKPYRFMWLAIFLSFAFYIPVVLLSDTLPAIGALMIPKTLAYVWVIVIGFMEMQKELKQNKVNS